MTERTDYEEVELDALRRVGDHMATLLVEAYSIPGTWGQYTDESRETVSEWQAIRDQAGDCDHVWTDARNRVIESGEICLECGAVRAGNKATQ